MSAYIDTHQRVTRASTRLGSLSFYQSIHRERPRCGADRSAAGLAGLPAVARAARRLARRRHGPLPRRHAADRLAAHARRPRDYATKGIAWAAMLPNRGVSSPIVVGDRVFLTADFSDLICLDKRTGKILWIRSNMEFEALSRKDREAMPEIAEKVEPLAAELARVNAAVVDELNARLDAAATAPYSLPKVFEQKRAVEKQIRDQQFAINRKRFTSDWPQAVYGFCTETPASDGQNVCAFFATGVSVCYDLEGNRKWIARGSHGGEEKGHYSSPLLLGNQFVVWGEPEIRAYDVKTGKVLWTSPAEGSNCQFDLPHPRRQRVGVEPANHVFLPCPRRPAHLEERPPDARLRHADRGRRHDLLLDAGPQARSSRRSRCPPAPTTAGSAAKLTFEPANWAEDELTGKFDKGAVNASPLFVDGLIYHLYPGGGLLVHDAATGQIVYRKVLPLKPRVEYWAWGGASASPTLAGKYIYLVDNQGGTVDHRAGQGLQGSGREPHRGAPGRPRPDPTPEPGLPGLRRPPLVLPHARAFVLHRRVVDAQLRSDKCLIRYLEIQRDVTIAENQNYLVCHGRVGRVHSLFRAGRRRELDAQGAAPRKAVRPAAAGRNSVRPTSSPSPERPRRLAGRLDGPLPRRHAARDVEPPRPGDHHRDQVPGRQAHHARRRGRQPSARVLHHQGMAGGRAVRRRRSGQGHRQGFPRRRRQGLAGQGRQGGQRDLEAPPRRHRHAEQPLSQRRHLRRPERRFRLLLRQPARERHASRSATSP